MSLVRFYPPAISTVVALAAMLLAMVAMSPAQARVPDFADLVEATSPAVVKIQTEQRSGGEFEQLNPDDLPEFFRDLLEKYGLPDPVPRGVGSGFLISEDGFVVTNFHVIDGADKVRVTLMDRREYRARVVGTDSRSDLALLKIDADDDLPHVDFAEPDDLRVGEWVVAIGSPFGLEYSASVGIVSAIGRSLPTGDGENYVPFIQSDVAINPGSSGGPLFNQEGDVVGINSQIYTRSGGSVGISFAIPISVATHVIEQLRERGDVQRGWLGVYIQEVSAELAASLGLDRPKGALVSQLFEGGPGERGGLQAGDVIVAFNGVDISVSGDLPHVVGNIAPGTRARATVIREGREIDIWLEVGKLPAADQVARQPAIPSGGDDLGLSVQDLDSDTASALNLAGGVVVDKVYPDSPASYTRLRAGDIVVQLGDNQVTSVETYRRVLEDLPRGVPVLIRFLRQGQFSYRTIELPP